MFEVHPSNWPVALDANDPRDHFHRTALAEARAATDRRGAAMRPTSARAALLERVRLALAGGTAQVAEPCNCAA
jgi:hypothetical protein